MRILLLTPQRPYPPHQGTTLRNFNLVKELARRHQVSVLTFLEPGQDPAQSGPLPDLCVWLETVSVPRRTIPLRLGQMLTTSRPDIGWRLWSPRFQERLAARLRETPFDLVQIEGLEMAPYYPTLAAAHPKPLIVYDAHNAEWILQKRAFEADRQNITRWPAALYSWVQWRRLRLYEAELLTQVDYTIAMSAPDKVALRDVAPQAPISVIPNGVDLEAYRDFAGPPVPSDLLFTGKMDYRPNIDAALWFGQEVLPLIQAQRPGTTFTIVGQQPHPRLAPLRRRPGITITGYVPDIRPYIAGASVYVAPLRVGGGTRLKLLEAMAMGKAIISTTVGAEGFPLSNGEHFLLADEPVPFAQAALDLLGDPARREVLGWAGRVFAQADYDWRHLVPKLEAIYLSLSGGTL
jgi:sugar transferase (PEP-CTERM/EpsH1 system associated)